MRLIFIIRSLRQDAARKQQDEFRKQTDREQNEQTLEDDIQSAIAASETRYRNIEQTLLDLNTTANGFTQERQELLTLLKVMRKQHDNLIQLKENKSAGYVYIIANSSFTEKNMIKIGITRHPDPKRFLRQHSQRTLPTQHEINSVVFCENAPRIVTKLYQQYSGHRVNLVAKDKGFFFASPQDVMQDLKQLQAQYNHGGLRSA